MKNKYIAPEIYIEKVMVGEILASSDTDIDVKDLTDTDTGTNNLSLD